MDNIRVEQKTSEWSRTRRRKKAWQRVLAGMMAVVVFSTTYALILPAITKEQETFCGVEEHEHTDACYAETQELVCTLPTEAHAHGDDCYTEQPALTCGLEETEGHAHSEACYEAREVYTCGLEEAEGHAHGADCYTQERGLICMIEDEAHEHEDACYIVSETLTCEIPETEGHVHTDACMGTEQALICGLEECEPHSHTIDCRGTERVLVCALAESEEGHEHTDECYTVAKTLTCEAEEHVHSLACFSDPEADLETEETWKRSVESLELTGVWADDVLAVAKSQLGQGESEKNYKVNERGDKQGYTRYGAWWGEANAYDPWCAMFVSFCLDFAKVDKDAFPQYAGCAQWQSELEKLELWRDAAEYAPKPGDVIFFDFPSDGSRDNLADHVGLVFEVEQDEAGAITKIVTVEGNNSTRVEKFTYDLTDSREDNIQGYGELPGRPVKLTATAEDGVTVTLSALPENLPWPVEELTLLVTPVEDEAAKALVEDAAETEAETEDGEEPTSRRETRLYDIKIMHGEEEVQPLGPVKVSFGGVETPKGDAQVFHVDPEAGTAEDVTAPAAGEDPTMQTGHFSIYGVTWTVDFWYGEYEYHLAGMESIRLSELFNLLAIERDAADAAAVEFTDYTLLAVTQLPEEGDWLLESLQAFDTEEELTVTFQNGDKLKIRVTDVALKTVDTGSGNTAFFDSMPLAHGKIDHTKVYMDNTGNVQHWNPGNIQYFRVENVTRVQGEWHLAERFGYKASDYCFSYSDYGWSKNGTNPFDMRGDWASVDFIDAVVGEDGSRKDLTMKLTPLQMQMMNPSTVTSYKNIYVFVHDSFCITEHDFPKDHSLKMRVKVEFDPHFNGGLLCYGFTGLDYDGWDAGEGVEEFWGFSGGMIRPNNTLNVSSSGDYGGVVEANGIYSPGEVYYKKGTGNTPEEAEQNERRLYMNNKGYDYGFAGLVNASGFGYVYETHGNAMHQFAQPFLDFYDVAFMSRYKTWSAAGLSDWQSGGAKGELKLRESDGTLTGNLSGAYLYRYGGPSKTVGTDCKPAEGYYASVYSEGNVVNGVGTLGNTAINNGNLTFIGQFLPKTGELTIKKTDAAGNPLTGAEFTLTGKSSLLQDVNANPFTLTSVPVDEVNKPGEYIIRNIPCGAATDSYSLSESTAPEGYDKLTETWTVTCTDNTSDDTAHGVNLSVTKQNGTALPASSAGASEVTWQNNILTVPNAKAGFRLKVEKTVLGGDTGKDFPFELVITDAQNQPVILPADTQTPARYSVDAAGKVSFAIRHGGSLELEGLPIGATLTLKEVLTDAEQAAYSVQFKEAAVTLTQNPAYTVTLQNVQADKTITVTNSNVKALPEAGGPGDWLPQAFGLTLMLGTVSAGLLCRRRKRQNC